MSDRWIEYDNKFFNLSQVVRFKIVDYAGGHHLIVILNATIHVTFDDEVMKEFKKITF